VDVLAGGGQGLGEGEGVDDAARGLVE